MKLKNINEIKDIKSFWDENGYLLIEDFLSEFETNHIKYLLERHADNDYNNMLNMDRYEYLIAQSLDKINNIKRISDKVDFLSLCKETSNTIRDLLKDKRIVDILEFLLNDDLVGLSTHMIWKKAGTKYSSQAWKPHQDNSNSQNINRKMITINLLLDNHTKENGCIYNYPGSHIDGLNEISELGTGYGNSDSPGHEVKISDKYEKCDVIGKKGTLYIQHGDLIHGSYSNKTNDETRGMYSATYIPKGEKFLPGANSRRKAIIV